MALFTHCLESRHLNPFERAGKGKKFPNAFDAVLLTVSIENSTAANDIVRDNDGARPG